MDVVGVEEVLPVVGQPVMAENFDGEHHLARGEAFGDGGGLLLDGREGGAPLDVVSIDGVGDFVLLSNDRDRSCEGALDDALAYPFVELRKEGGPFDREALGLGRVGDRRGELRQ